MDSDLLVGLIFVVIFPAVAILGYWFKPAAFTAKAFRHAMQALFVFLVIGTLLDVLGLLPRDASLFLSGFWPEQKPGSQSAP